MRRPSRGALAPARVVAAGTRRLPASRRWCSRALRDDSDEAAEARQEPVLAIVLLAGFAGVLSTSLAGRLLDNPDSAARPFACWLWGFSAAPSTGRHLLAGRADGSRLASRASAGRAPTGRRAMSSASPPRRSRSRCFSSGRSGSRSTADDLFRNGRLDTGVGDKIFEGLVVVAFVWTLALVFVGARTVSGLSWPRRR